jgi:hypothetical protein
MACSFCFFLVICVNLDNQHEGDKLPKAAFNRSLATLTGASFSIFTFGFHVHIAAEQH